MEPVKIEDGEIGRPCIRHALAEGQPYTTLPAVKVIGQRGEVVTRWTFTPEERQRIAAGEDLYISSLTFGSPFHPILPTVGMREDLAAPETPR